MSKSTYHMKAWTFYLTVMLILLKPITGYAAENVDLYRATFNADYYYNQYPDLQAAIGYDPERLFSHYATIGAREGRSGNEEFNLRAYVLYNHDLLDVYKTNLPAYCKHYVETGKAEGRISLPQGNEQGLIGTYTTKYDASLPRAVNIAIAVQRINGTVLQPGEVFSFSNAVLSRTPQNGYVMAPAIGGNEYGGGICQVSSTLYAAMCHALLPATERYPHSSRVSYLPVGLDATISEGRKDLKFVNPYQDPLMISITTEEGILTASLSLNIEEQIADQGDTTQGDTTQGDTTQGDTTPGDTTQGDTTQSDTSQSEAPDEQTDTENTDKPIEQEEIGPGIGLPVETQATE